MTFYYHFHTYTRSWKIETNLLHAPAGTSLRLSLPNVACWARCWTRLGEKWFCKFEKRKTKNPNKIIRKIRRKTEKSLISSSLDVWSHLRRCCGIGSYLKPRRTQNANGIDKNTSFSSYPKLKIIVRSRQLHRPCEKTRSDSADYVMKIQYCRWIRSYGDIQKSPWIL